MEDFDSTETPNNDPSSYPVKISSEEDLCNQSEGQNVVELQTSSKTEFENESNASNDMSNDHNGSPASICSSQPGLKSADLQTKKHSSDQVDSNQETAGEKCLIGCFAVCSCCLCCILAFCCSPCTSNDD